MNTTRRRVIAIAAAIAVLAGAAIPFLLPRSFHYLPGNPTQFVATFAPPPARDSAQTRRELDALLELQRARTPAEVERARDDRKKDLARFHEALGFGPADVPSLPRVQALTNRVEEDIGPYVRAAKEEFRRLRPYEIEPKLDPCIGGVKGDLSYPSGHATYGYVTAYLLAELVPEKRAALEARADEFARQRAVCGVHFPSDLEAGRTGARWLVDEIDKSAAFRADRDAARDELRAALKLPRAD